MIDKNNQFTHVQTYLSSNDIDRIKTLIPNFIINALMPFVETQMQYLNEMVKLKYLLNTFRNNILHNL